MELLLEILFILFTALIGLAALGAYTPPADNRLLNNGVTILVFLDLVIIGIRIFVGMGGK